MTRGRLTRSARDVAVFVAAAVLLIGFIVMGLDYAADELVGGRGPRLDTWDVLLAAGTSLGLLTAAVLLRSWGVGFLAIIFSVIALSEQFPWYGDVGRSLAGRVDLTGLQQLVPAGEPAWAEFLVGTAVAVVGGIVVFLAPGTSMFFRRARQVLLLYLVLLFVFAAGVDLLSAAWDSPGLGWIEEFGERLTLSAAAGYVVGLVLVVAKTPSPGRTRSGHASG